MKIKKSFVLIRIAKERVNVSETGQGLKASVAHSYSLAAQTSFKCRTHCSPAQQKVALITEWKPREIKLHVYEKRQTSDSSWEFLKIENKQIKTAQNNSYG